MPVRAEWDWMGRELDVRNAAKAAAAAAKVQGAARAAERAAAKQAKLETAAAKAAARAETAAAKAEAARLATLVPSSIIRRKPDGTVVRAMVAPVADTTERHGEGRGMTPDGTAMPRTHEVTPHAHMSRRGQGKHARARASVRSLELGRNRFARW